MIEALLAVVAGACVTLIVWSLGDMFEARAEKTHEVRVLCNCDDPEHCRMEIYVSDVRIAAAELERLKGQWVLAHR